MKKENQENSKANDKDILKEEKIVEKNISLDDVYQKMLESNLENEVEFLKKNILEISEEKDALKEENILSIANLQNVVKRRDALESDLRKYSSSKLGELIIPDIALFKKVLSSQENSENQELKNYLMGFDMIVKKMENSLEEVGIKEFIVKVGSDFDSYKEESIEQIETDEFKSGQIVEVVSNGYMIYDRVLVHAKVKVAK